MGYSWRGKDPCWFHRLKYIYIYIYRLNSVKSSGIKRWRALKERGNTMGVYSEPRQVEDTIYFDVFPQRSLRWYFFDVRVSSFLKIKAKNDWCVFIWILFWKTEMILVYWIFCVIERKKDTFYFYYSEILFWKRISVWVIKIRYICKYRTICIIQYMQKYVYISILYNSL